VRRVAISGHRGLPVDTEQLVDAGLRAAVEEASDGSGLVGLTCLADGPDTTFARMLLAAGGTLTVVVPARKYRDSLPAEHHPDYDQLLAAATDVIELDREESDSDAHMAASLRMLEDVDRLIAVWDGKPARGFGGTADVVTAARERGIEITVVWPDGATRD